MQGTGEKEALQSPTFAERPKDESSERLHELEYPLSTAVGTASHPDLRTVGQAVSENSTLFHGGFRWERDADEALTERSCCVK